MTLDEKFEFGDDPMKYRNDMFDLLRTQCHNNQHRGAECYQEDQTTKYMYCGKCYTAYQVKKEYSIDPRDRNEPGKRRGKE